MGFSTPTLQRSAVLAYLDAGRGSAAQAVAGVAPAVAGGDCGGPHQWAWRGAAPRDAVPTCERPVQLGCNAPGCGKLLAVECRTSNGANCAPCAIRYRSRVRRVSGSGLVRVLPGQSVLLTLTAPTSRVHYFGGSVCGCVAPGLSAAAWNGSEGQRWNRFVTQLRRLLGEQVEFFCGIETQGRGLLHRHAVIRADFASVVICSGQVRRLSDGRVSWCREGACQRPGYALCVADVRALAVRFGYGHEVDWSVIEDGERAARYVTKYVTKSSADRQAVPWVRELRKGTRARDRAVADGRPPLGWWPTYRLWTCSRGWGVSMGSVVAAQRHWAAVVGALPSWADRPSWAHWAEYAPPVPAPTADPAPG